MRISTKIIFDSGSSQISKLQSQLVKTQDQISTQRRVLVPSDDPIASARALIIKQNQALNTQYAANRANADSSLNMEEGTLASVTDLVESIQEEIKQAGNGSYDDTQRSYIATQLRSQLEELIGMSNTKDGAGNYLFSGYKTSTQPFNSTSSGVQYMGDQGQRSVQVGSTRQLAISDSGYDVFMNIPSSGSYSAKASSGNTGNASASVSVADASALTGHQYSVAFADDGSGGYTYNVFDSTTGSATPVASGAYTDPTDITFDGLNLSVSGTPADGDAMSVGSDSSQSIFDMMSNLISVLETPASTDTELASLKYGLDAATTNFNNALDNILTVRASVGARLNEISSLNTAGDASDTQYTKNISDLMDVDLVKAASDLAQQKTVLQAAQSSYVTITSLSIFKYL